MVKDIIDFNGLQFDKEAKRVKVERPTRHQGNGAYHRRDERPGVTRNLRNFFSILLG